MFSPETTQLLAVAVLAGLALLLLVWLLRVYYRTSYTVAQIPFYVLNLFMTRVLWRATVHGQFPLAPGQGGVIVCNHIGPIDPGFISLTVPRPVHWMVAREYFTHPLFGLGLKALQAIPVNRGGVDTASTKLAIRYAQAGDLVGIFPEGRINTTEQFMLPGRTGAAMIALRARVPLVPCYIHGAPYDGTAAGFLITPARATLIVGQAIDLSPWYERASEKEAQAEVTLLAMRAIARLAGRPDFEPTLAGRIRKGEGVEEGVGGRE